MVECNSLTDIVESIGIDIEDIKEMAKSGRFTENMMLDIIKYDDIKI